MHVLGAELALPSPMRYMYIVAQRWADAMMPGAGAVTYLAGRSTADPASASQIQQALTNTASAAAARFYEAAPQTQKRSFIYRTSAVSYCTEYNIIIVKQGRGPHHNY